MKNSVMNPMAALDALRGNFPLLVLFAVAAVGTLAISQPNGWMFVVAIIVVGAFASSITYAAPGTVALFYCVYLMFEGAFKILTNYNIAFRFGSDALLGFAFLRLMGRHQREGNPDLHPEVRRRFGTLVGFFTLFWLWVAIQFLNPWGLGFFPSVAGLKVYLIPLLVFFAVGIFMRNEELVKIPPLLLGMGLFQAVVSVIDWWQGPMGLPMLHPKYAEVLWNFLQGFPYRPFGTTNLPGAPALWMFHCMSGALLTLAMLKGKTGTKANWLRAAFILFTLFGFATLIACQVRVSLLRYMGMLLGGLLIIEKRQAIVLGTVFVGILLSVLSLSEMSYQEALSKKSFVKVEDRFQIAISRLATLKSGTEWQNARGGSWAYNEFFNRADQTTAGIGLSRVGASSAPWAERIKEDQHFSMDWGFTDNLALALFTELGFGGLIGYVCLVLAVLAKLAKVGTLESGVALVSCSLVFFSGWGSEGILFQPDASMFWLVAAYGLRSPGKGLSEL